jgi:signal transduction histidine kinase
VGGRESLERLDTLVEDVLALSKEVKVIGETEPLRAEPGVGEAWRNVETESASLRVEGDLGTVETDASRLRELLANRLRNAVEHAGPGIAIRVVRRADTVYVADDGPGVPASLRETIFDHGYSTTPGGTGYGLAIVGPIADGHGWTLSVTDSDDGGAQFELRGLSDR